MTVVQGVLADHCDIVLIELGYHRKRFFVSTGPMRTGSKRMSKRGSRAMDASRVLPRKPLSVAAFQAESIMKSDSDRFPMR